MRAIELKNVKKGDYFTLKPIEAPTEKQVWKKDDYDRRLKKYECYRYEDICDYRYFSPTKIVYVDFVF